MNWFYKGKEINKVPKGTYGFVYLLKYEGGFSYIGMKTTIATLEKPAKKSGEVRDGCIRVYHNIYRDPDTNKVIVSKKDQRKARTKGIKATREAFDKGVYESNWKDYESSSKDVKDYKLVSKEILEFAQTKRLLTYLEVKYLFAHEAIINPKYLNKNIINRWFRNNILE
jgi:hypothetical protein